MVLHLKLSQGKLHTEKVKQYVNSVDQVNVQKKSNAAQISVCSADDSQQKMFSYQD